MTFYLYEADYESMGSGIFFMRYLAIFRRLMEIGNIIEKFASRHDIVEQHWDTFFHQWGPAVGELLRQSQTKTRLWRIDSKFESINDRSGFIHNKGAPTARGGRLEAKKPPKIDLFVANPPTVRIPEEAFEDSDEPVPPPPPAKKKKTIIRIPAPSKTTTPSSTQEYPLENTPVPYYSTPDLPNEWDEAISDRTPVADIEYSTDDTVEIDEESGSADLTEESFRKSQTFGKRKRDSDPYDTPRNQRPFRPKRPPGSSFKAPTLNEVAKLVSDNSDALFEDIVREISDGLMDLFQRSLNDHRKAVIFRWMQLLFKLHSTGYIFEGRYDLPLRALRIGLKQLLRNDNIPLQDFFDFATTTIEDFFVEAFGTQDLEVPIPVIVDVLDENEQEELQRIINEKLDQQKNEGEEDSGSTTTDAVDAEDDNLKDIRNAIEKRMLILKPLSKLKNEVAVNLHWTFLNGNVNLPRFYKVVWNVKEGASDTVMLNIKEMGSPATTTHFYTIPRHLYE